MKPRMSVARCCCPKGPAPPPVPVPQMVRGSGRVEFNTGLANPIDSPSGFGKLAGLIGAPPRTSGYVWLGQTAVGETGPLIPPGSTITAANFVLDEVGQGAFSDHPPSGVADLNWSDLITPPPPPVDGTYFARCRIRGCLQASPTNPILNEDLAAKPRTTAFVDWQLGVTVSGGSTVFTSEYPLGDVAFSSPDLSAIIQEIVDQGGWASGNSMMLFWDEEDGTDEGDNGSNNYWAAFAYFIENANLVDPWGRIDIAWT